MCKSESSRSLAGNASQVFESKGKQMKTILLMPEFKRIKKFKKQASAGSWRLHRNDDEGHICFHLPGRKQKKLASGENVLGRVPLKIIIPVSKKGVLGDVFVFHRKDENLGSSKKAIKALTLLLSHEEIKPLLKNRKYSVKKKSVPGAEDLQADSLFVIPESVSGGISLGNNSALMGLKKQMDENFSLFDEIVKKHKEGDELSRNWYFKSISGKSLVLYYTSESFSGRAICTEKNEPVFTTAPQEGITKRQLSQMKKSLIRIFK